MTGLPKVTLRKACVFNVVRGRFGCNLLESRRAQLLSIVGYLAAGYRRRFSTFSSRHSQAKS